METRGKRVTRLMGRDVNAVIPLEFRERRRGIKAIPPVGNSKRRDESFESSNFPFFLLGHHRTTLYSHCSITVVTERRETLGRIDELVLDSVRSPS